MDDFKKIQDREAGLHKKLTAQQMSMIAIGGAIGTGLFLGSKFAISYAGPGVIVSYLIGGVITLSLMACLAEMTVQHPTSGSFAAYAEHYLHPIAGYLVRYSYWVCIVLAVGTEITAVAEYMKFWFKDLPSWIWIILFSLLIVSVNVYSVKTFGTVEYWLSAIKVFAIVAFILMSISIIFIESEQMKGINAIIENRDWFPFGFKGIWIGVIISIFSYLSIEMIAVAAGEAKEPEKAVKYAFKATIFRLLIFYILSLSMILILVPWKTLVEEGTTSPFVTVMRLLDIPFADSILNFVVIVAALSAMNSMLYIATRMLFSLSRANDAPDSLGKIGKNGVPVNALVVSSAGIAIATFVYIFYPQDAFAIMIALSMFGALFTWLMIFITHLMFRYNLYKNNVKLKYRIIGFPIFTLFGIISLFSIMITTIFTDDFHLTMKFGSGFIIFLLFSYFFKQNSHRLKTARSRS
ncbi:amino acid permease [Vibrio metschnikovii]|uniref:amino acid permease n=1 Tax=Vibrio metschnikovii TaxID=28172 RepID=UPI001C3004F7|nr:amino acid permease [Vibrio metschnikovii]